jgi:hypothetical protein
LTFKRRLVSYLPDDVPFLLAFQFAHVTGMNLDRTAWWLVWYLHQVSPFFLSITHVTGIQGSLAPVLSEESS